MSAPTDLPLFTTTVTRPQARRLAGTPDTPLDGHPPAAPAPPIPPVDPVDPADLDGHNGPGTAPPAPADPDAVRQVQAAVSSVLAAAPEGHDPRQVIADEVTAHNQRRLRVGTPALNPEQQALLRQAVYDAVYGLGPLQPLLDLPDLENLEVRHGADVWLVFTDRVEPGPRVFANDQDVIEFIARLARAGAIERPFDKAHRHLDLTLPDGSRLSASAWFTPYPVLTIRKHRYVDVDLADLRRLGMISASIEALLTALVHAGKSILISGIPDAGKTTLARGVLNTLPVITPIATIETEDELGLHTLKHRHARVWAGQEMVGGGEVVNGRIAGQLTVADMIPMALRAGAQIICVGEVRGHEAIAMLQAMQAGHNSVSTIHAKNGRDTVERMVTCITEYGEKSTTWAYRQVSQLVDVIVHVARVDETHLGGRKHRYVDEIVLPELSGDAGYSVPALYRPGPDGRAVPDTVVRPGWLDELELHGFDRRWLDPSHGGWDQPLHTLTRQGTRT